LQNAKKVAVFHTTEDGFLMIAQKHAETLRIFSFIYSAIQFVISLLVGGYVLLSILGILIMYNNVTRAQLLLAVVIDAVLGIAAILGLTTSILNFRQGLRLGRRQDASRALVIVTSVVNIVSFLSVGIVISPVGIALGIYGMWFGLSDVGRSYLSSRTPQSSPLQPAPLSAFA
jgi:hypothetical protein